MSLRTAAVLLAKDPRLLIALLLHSTGWKGGEASVSQARESRGWGNTGFILSVFSSGCLPAQRQAFQERKAQHTGDNSVTQARRKEGEHQ